MKKWHFYTGLITLSIFALTGQYMEHFLQLAEQDFAVQRMMYRASHIYLFFVGAINLVLGCFWRPLAGGWQYYLQLFGSLLTMLAQLVLMVAFVVEPAQIDHERNITFFGCVLILIALLIYAGLFSRGEKNTK